MMPFARMLCADSLDETQLCCSRSPTNPPTDQINWSTYNAVKRNVKITIGNVSFLLLNELDHPLYKNIYMP